jgi:hypothetical protein
MPKVVATGRTEKFLAALAGGDSPGVAARQFGFTSGTVSIWARNRPEFAARLAAAHEQGKRARKVRQSAQTRQLLAAAVGGPPATDAASRVSDTLLGTAAR